jgi:hypothetical protein
VRNQRSAPLQGGRTSTQITAKVLEAVEPARIKSGADVSQIRGEPLADNVRSLDGDHRRKHADKKCMQGAAVIGVVSGLTALVMCASRAILVMQVLIMDVLIMDVRNGRIRQGLRACERRRYHTRELGDQEQGDKRADKAGSCSEPLHGRRSAAKSLMLHSLEGIGRGRQSRCATGQPGAPPWRTINNGEDAVSSTVDLRQCPRLGHANVGPKVTNGVARFHVSRCH